jgi:scytalone dehydratase
MGRKLRYEGLGPSLQKHCARTSSKHISNPHLSLFTQAVKIDYRAVTSKLFEALPAASFLEMVSSPQFLGNLRIKTQHFVGASKWAQTALDEITGLHQMRVAHQKYADDDLKNVSMKGHAHGKATIWYKRMDGVWKFAGIEPDIRWGEYDPDKIFEHAA